MIHPSWLCAVDRLLPGCGNIDMIRQAAARGKGNPPICAVEKDAKGPDSSGPFSDSMLVAYSP